MITDYLKHLQQKGKSPHTIVSYMNDLHKIPDDLGIQPGDYITKMDVKKMDQSDDPTGGRSAFSECNHQSSVKFAAQLL